MLLENKVAVITGGGRGYNSFAVTADISTDRDLTIAVEQIHQYFGRVDILVNNAGVQFKGRFAEMSMTEWD